MDTEHRVNDTDLGPGTPGTIQVDLNGIDPLALFGERDATLRRVEESFRVSAVLRNGILTLTGSPPALDQAGDVLRELVSRVARGQSVDLQDVEYLAQLRVEEGSEAVVNGGALEELPFELRSVQLKSRGQQAYVDAIRAHDVVFGIGPAGTGKTYLAVAMGVQALRQKRVEKIVLTRPAVEAGEKLGFLPGTFEEKIDPYLRPLHDALRDFLPFEKLKRLQEMGVLEIAPLAYMRGRTLSRAFVVLDEAQNTTLAQMKMFLTRLGINSSAVITGDVTQVDLVNPKESGLIQAEKILSRTEGIAFVYFHSRDVVRHRLVKAILTAFQRFEEAKEAERNEGR